MRPAQSLSLLVAVAAGVTVLAAPAQAAHESITVTGLTLNDRLVSFQAGTPGTTTRGVKITGLGGDLLGIDYRPATDELYGVVRDRDGSGRVVTIDDATGAVTSSIDLVSPAGEPTTLVGRAFGVDFNPAADALRIVSDADQNLRALPSTRAAGVAGTTFTDGSLSPVGAAVTAAAYTNSDTDPATGTALYDLSSSTGGLLLQNPPNDGTLVPVGDGTGLPVDGRTGFDVYTDGATNIALVSVVQRGRGVLSVLDLATGEVVPSTTMQIGSAPAVVDIAVPTDQ